MNSIKKTIIENKNSIRLYGGIIILAFLICGVFLRFHMTSDSYSWILNKFYFVDNALFSIGGRPISDFFLYYTEIINLNMIKYQTFYNFISIIIMICSTILLYKLILKLKITSFSNKKFIILASFLIIFNVFGFEMFLYNVMFSLSIQYLLIIYSLKILLDKTDVKNIITAILLNFLGLCVYQAIGSLFLPLGIILIGYKVREQKNIVIIKEYLKLVFIYGVACVLNLTIIKMVAANRYDTAVSIYDNFIYMMNGQKTVWINSFGVLPKYFFLGSIIILLLISFIIILKNKKVKMLKMLSILIFSIAALVFLSLAPLLLAKGWMVPRTCMILSTIPGIILLFISLFGFNDEKNHQKVLEYILAIILFIYISFMLNAAYIMNNSLLLVNSIDKSTTLKIEKIIKKYEKNNNVEITKVSFKNDLSVGLTQANFRFPGMDAFARAYATPWSRLGIMEYYMKRDFIEVEMSEGIYSQFKNMDWNEFDETQIIIKDNILNIMIY